MSKPLAKKEGDEFTYKGRDYIVAKVNTNEEGMYRCKNICDIYNTCISSQYFNCQIDLVIKLNEEEIW